MAARKKKPKAGPQCDCISKINKRVEKEVDPNKMLDARFSLSMGAILVMPLVKRDSSIRGKSTSNFIIVSYCPFCGKKYLYDD